ncbi:MAG: PAS domain-containing sensor histidine kinase [Cyclobacteriaceae bacterium]
MFAREFRVNVIIRVVIITTIALMLAYVLTNRSWFFTPLVLIILLLTAVWSLVYYIERTNKDLTHFILSIKQGGFTSSFPAGKRGDIHRKLSEAFNDVIEEFRKINLQRETHYQYLQILTENIQAGIISFDLEGNVMSVNPAARQLLNVFQLSNTRDIKSVNPKLHRTIIELEPGQRQLLRVVIANREIRLSLQVKELILDEKPFRVILLQDLNTELEEQEVDAWQKLIRVLTHEIMNSVTPIVSLTESLNALLANPDGARKPLQSLDEEDKEDLYGSLQTIENRSKGLLRFVNAYKDFTKTPELTLETIDVSATIGRVVTLLHQEFDLNKIAIDRTDVNTKTMAKADGEWLEQVLINLFRNSIEALNGTTNPTIKVAAYAHNHRTFVSIIDNGSGMDEETLEKAFIPFFTTKKKGSGIGLSLSRQIMRLHRGSLLIKSKEGEGTQAILEW